MVTRTVAAGPEQWALVGTAVYERRVALDLTASEVVERAGRGLSLSQLSLIENNRRESYSTRTLAALCRGLGWTPDSIDRILRGEEPVVAFIDVDDADDRVARLQQRLDAVLARVEKLEAEHERTNPNAI